MSSGIGVCLIAATIFLLVPPPVWPSCDLIVHVKSATDKQFKAQVIAPNGQKSEKWTFRQNRQRETFQQKAATCSIGQWQIQSFDQQGVGKANENVMFLKIISIINVFYLFSQVTLEGIGRVLYEIGDNLVPVQIERQGAICSGKCAPLATPTH